MEKYNKTIAKLDNVAFIHVSRDSDEDSAEEWAAKEQFPWLTVMKDKTEASGLGVYKTTKSVPEYHLIDGDGKTIVAGSSSSTKAFAKIAELGKVVKEE